MQMRGPSFPQTIRVGSVQTKVYRVVRKDGREIFSAAWHVGGVRRQRHFPNLAAAQAEARYHAEQLAAGKVEASATTSVEDGATLAEARRICGTVPVIAALQEWSRARKLCGGTIMPAAEAWAASKNSLPEPIGLQRAIDSFIKAKDAAGNQGERTYRSKLQPLVTRFGDQTPVDEITTSQLEDYLGQFSDGVTRNDMRKRATTLWRWLKHRGHLPENSPLAIERTLRAKEKPTEIGIISPEHYAFALEYVRARHPEHLAALVLAGMCGLRSDEIHGKRDDRERRQLWEDIRLEEKYVRVTVAKTNTPAWRHVPLCDSARKWLLVCPERRGPVCEPGAMEKVRLILREATDPSGRRLVPNLPDNCFRHSFISYRIAVTGDKARTAIEAGNSVKEIDRRYRVPVTHVEGLAWFGINVKASPGNPHGTQSSNAP